ncbi:hypothetical protein [Pseudorhodoplanes sp.]
MKSFLLACVAVVILAVGGFYVLERFQEPSSVAFTSSGARV